MRDGSGVACGFYRGAGRVPSPPLAANGGEIALACHLAEFAARAAPEDAVIREMRASVDQRRAESGTNLMMRRIYLEAADDPCPVHEWTSQQLRWMRDDLECLASTAIAAASRTVGIARR
ncbi:MAG: hypothetical protein M3008_08365 [Chloroflexota bacterium]|nr:hypothetical protein [Chloroflexota bacterium]